MRPALTVQFRPHHGFRIAQFLAQLGFIEETMAQVSAQITGVIAPSPRTSTAST